MNPDLLPAALIGIACIFYLFWPKPKRPKKEILPVVFDAEEVSKDDDVPENAIVLDGSNILFWGGEPSTKALSQLVKDLRQKGFAPIAIFDASAGYRLHDKFMNAEALSQTIGLPRRHVYVVHKGVVADEVILDFATEHRLRVISNDRYRDWSVQFPLVKEKGRLLKGTFKHGSVMLKGL